jgi:hypothetical protein
MWTIAAWVLEKCAHDYFVDVASLLPGKSTMPAKVKGESQWLRLC